MEWTKYEYNSCLRGEGFHISYNPDTNANPMNALYNKLGSLVGLEAKGGGETALHTDTEPTWRILNGDWRKEYEEAFPLGIDACIAVYERHKATHRSDWSNDEISRSLQRGRADV